MSPDSIKCLDHGFIRLVDSMGNDLSIVRAARVSHDAAWRAGENEGSDHRLIRYLWHNKHVSPFEAVTFTFEVKAPIFVFRQWHRHKWSFNELSGRYRELPEEFYTPDPMVIGTQAAKNKQARDTSDTNQTLLCARRQQTGILRRQNEAAFATYKALLGAGWPRELARTILPLGTYSHMFATANLRSVLHFLDLRDHSHAQHEIRVYAQAIRELIRAVVPVAVEAWEENS